MTEPLKILDLFSGIGGFSYAAEHFFQGQFKTTQFVEINPYSQKVLAKNFKGVPIHDDIKTFTAKQGEYQIITGGFPCQDISVAGQQKGIGEGTRSGLFYECIRILREVQPKFAIFENVRNLLSIEEGKVFQEVLFQITQAGYDAEWSVVSARDVGGCHLRERVWIIAYPKHNGSSTPKRIGFNDKTNSGTQKRQNKISQPERGCESQSSKTIQRTTTTQTTNSNIKGLEGLRGEHELQESCGEEKARWSTQPYTLEPDWRSYNSEPTISRGNDGLPRKLDSDFRNRKERIICLGNAVTPQQAAIPLGRIIDLIKS